MLAIESGAGPGSVWAAAGAAPVAADPASTRTAARQVTLSRDTSLMGDLREDEQGVRVTVE